MYIVYRGPCGSSKSSCRLKPLEFGSLRPFPFAMGLQKESGMNLVFENSFEPFYWSHYVDLLLPNLKADEFQLQSRYMPKLIVVVTYSKKCRFKEKSLRAERIYPVASWNTNEKAKVMWNEMKKRREKNPFFSLSYRAKKKKNFNLKIVPSLSRTLTKIP